MYNEVWIQIFSHKDDQFVVLGECQGQHNICLKFQASQSFIVRLYKKINMEVNEWWIKYQLIN